MQLRGVNVSYCDINNSGFTFTPDIKNNRILYGLKCLPNLNDESTNIILENRPFYSLDDFLNRLGGNPNRESEIDKETKRKGVSKEQLERLILEKENIQKNKLPKKVITTLIKAGAFNNIEQKNVIEQMASYCKFLYIPKKDVTIRDVDILVKSNILQKEKFNKEIRLWYYRTFLMKNCKSKIKKVCDGLEEEVPVFELDGQTLSFYHEFFDPDFLILNNNKVFILQKTKEGFEGQYETLISPLKEYLNKNKEDLLKKINNYLFNKSFMELCKGVYNKSAWEMETMCFYYSGHELRNVDSQKYNFSSFEEMLEDPQIDSYYEKGEKKIPLYKIERIAGTIIAKNKNRSYITLNTLDGVVNVKFSKELFSDYNKRISKMQPNGKKKVIEESWFKRGTMVIVSGYRIGSDFKCKTYKNKRGYPFIQKIAKIDINNNLVLQSKRKEE